MRTFRRVRKAYRRFAKRNRKPLIRANKLALKAVWNAIGSLRLGMNVERKYWDKLSLVSSTVTDLAPTILATPWDGLVSGTGPTDRIGDQIKALWTTYRCRMTYAPTTLGTNAQRMVRILVILDTEPRGAGPVSAVTLRDSILQNTATGPLQVTSPYKTTQTLTAGAVGDRWKVLRDFRVSFDNVHKKNHEININLKHTYNKYRGMRVKYQGDFPADDRLYILAVTDSSTADDIVINGDFSRMCFVDN